MPELAEVRLTSEYVHRVCEKKTFHSVWKNPNHKGNSFEIPYSYNLSSVARGKEMMLIFKPAQNSFTDSFGINETMHLRMTMGMSGHFRWIGKEDEKPKHTHLSFISNLGQLCFVDVRRFGRWAFGTWNPKRGPDPTQEHESFLAHVYSNLKSKSFERPIHEVLMNQDYFNGIGNYLRAEILYRIDCSPFLPAREFILRHPEVLLLCRDLPIVAYGLGGGRFKDWKNPDGQTPTNWDEFMLCYGNRSMSKITDKNGRTFWFDPKWI